MEKAGWLHDTHDDRAIDPARVGPDRVERKAGEGAGGLRERVLLEAAQAVGTYTCSPAAAASFKRSERSRRGGGDGGAEEESVAGCAICGDERCECYRI